MISMFRKTLAYLAACFQSSYEFSRVPTDHVIVNCMHFIILTVVMKTINVQVYTGQKNMHVYKGALAIRRVFSLVDRITKPKFSNCPNVFKIGLFR